MTNAELQAAREVLRDEAENADANETMQFGLWAFQMMPKLLDEIASLHEEVSTFRDALIYACDSFATMSDQRETVRAIRTAANKTNGSFREAYDAIDVYRSRKATL